MLTNKEDEIWIIKDSVYPAQFIDKTVKFQDTEDKFSISIIDQFYGKTPQLLNQEIIQNKTISFGINPIVMLDSQVASYLHQYVTNSNSLKKNQQEVIKEFLHYLIKKRVDYNPSFYYTEAMFKSTKENFQKYVKPITVSILRLHTMNEEVFLRNGIIEEDFSILKEYLKKYDVTTIEEIADIQIKGFLKDFKKIQNDINEIDGIYLLLLKITLIHKTNNFSVKKKLKDLYDFMINELNTFFVREYHLAALYFTGEINKLINIQSNMSIEEAKKNLRATAWDIYLTRLPESMLKRKDNILDTVYIATAEKELQELAKLFNITMLLNKNNKIHPMLEFTYHNINKHFSEKEQKDLFLFPSIERLSEISKKEKKYISAVHLRKKIREQEFLLSDFCKKKIIHL